MTSAAVMREVVARYFACLDREDWDGMRELWCADGRLRAVGARPRDDRDEVIAFFSKLFAPWKEHEDRPTRVLVAESDATAVAEVLFIGRTADGRQVRFEAVDVFDFAEGRISRLSNWYDIDYARRALASS
jgi:ketosteroid isomerase-like protein